MVQGEPPEELTREQRRRWTHCLCNKCWLLAGLPTKPERVEPRPDDICCRCRVRTRSGIYIRANPRAMSCQGEDGTHKDGAASRL